MSEKVEKLLKNLKHYRFAKNNYEKHNPYPQAGIANYDGMPSGSGPPELFFAQQGRMADMGNTSIKDAIDYKQYKEAVDLIEGALDTLTDDERSIVTLKWVHKLSLKEIADRKNMGLTTVKSKHRSALSSLEICFRFYQPPQIEEFHKGSQHERFSNTNRTRDFMDIT